MTKEQRNLIEQRKVSKLQRRLKARWNGVMPKAYSPGYSPVSKDNNKDARAWVAAW